MRGFFGVPEVFGNRRRSVFTILVRIILFKFWFFSASFYFVNILQIERWGSIT